VIFQLVNAAIVPEGAAEASSYGSGMKISEDQGSAWHKNARELAHRFRPSRDVAEGQRAQHQIRGPVGDCEGYRV
jgi:hypothetical protein